jgi:hypothetical protein
MQGKKGFVMTNRSDGDNCLFAPRCLMIMKSALLSPRLGSTLVSNGRESHLDLAKARIIRAQWEVAPTPEIGLDLSRYLTATVPALDHLAPIEGKSLRLGLNVLSSSMARGLRQCAAHFLIFTRLEGLTHKAAVALAQGCGHLVIFERRNGLTIAAEDLAHSPVTRLT